MLKYCLKAKKATESVDSKVLKTKKGRTMLLSKCSVFGSKNSRFVKEQEGKGLLSCLGLKTQLIKVPLLIKNPLLTFCFECIK